MKLLISASRPGLNMQITEQVLVLLSAAVPGASGASAYELAVASGFVGSEAEWLASLPGADGLDSIFTAKADQAAAEAGADDELGMTPLKTAQAIAAQAGGGGGEWTDIGDPVVAVAAASVEFTGLDGTYKEYRIKSFDLRVSGGDYVKAFFQTAAGWIEAWDYESQIFYTRGSSVLSGSSSQDYGMRLSPYNAPRSDSETCVVEIRIFNHANSAAQTVLRADLTWYSASYQSGVFCTAACTWDVPRPDNVTGVRLFGQTGTISGTFQLQGRN